jgi:hypothetical protein
MVFLKREEETGTAFMYIDNYTVPVIFFLIQKDFLIAFGSFHHENTIAKGSRNLN